MPEIKKGKFCYHCKQQTLHTAATANHLIHLVMTIITFGMWIPIWAWAAILHGKWLCSNCGSAFNGSKARRAKRQ